MKEILGNILDGADGESEGLDGVDGESKEMEDYEDDDGFVVQIYEASCRTKLLELVFLHKITEWKGEEDWGVMPIYFKCCSASISCEN